MRDPGESPGARFMSSCKGKYAGDGGISGTLGCA
jgi:hypothetical protein